MNDTIEEEVTAITQEVPGTAVRPSDDEYERNAERAFAGKEPDQAMSSMGGEFLTEFNQAEMDRRPTEERWLEDLRQYKGKYNPEEEAAIGAQRSKSFVRKTRVKVKTVDSRVADLLFPAGNDKNWNIDPTPVPTVSDDERQEIILQLKQTAQAAQQATQQQQAPGPEGQVTPAQQQNVGEPPDDVVTEMIKQRVKVASKEMSKVIDDQLVEAKYKDQAIKVLHSGHIYGTGILKGPLVERKVRTRFDKTPATRRDGTVIPNQFSWMPRSETYVVPFVDHVPLWRFYPDMSATNLDECQFIYERHTFNRAKLFELSKKKSFNSKRILEHLEANPNGSATLTNFENDLKSIGERDSKQGDTKGQYDLIERWGYVAGYKLKQDGIEVPVGREQEAFFCNVWILPNGTVIKAVLQPINGTTWPYHLYYFDKDETSIFGEGLSSIMRDDQKMVNAGTRMMLDNAAITSGPMLEVVLDLLSSGEDPTDIRPWKVWLRKQADANKGPAVKAIEMPNNLEDLERMVNMFDKNADEVTAIPKYVTGENATTGAAGTASGMSMLMGAVNIVIKDLLTAYDSGITVPFIQALYHWNMQFNKRADIKGDFDIYARGNASLVAKEMRARQLAEFHQITANPDDAKYIKRHKLLQAQAECLELSDIVKTEDEVKAEEASEQAQAMQQMQMQMQQAQLAEQQAKAAKLMAEAELSKRRAEEGLASIQLMEAQVKKTMADIDAIVAKTVSTKVEAIFAALQAGGVATQNPVTAPAGDEILKSAGYIDVNGDPSIAQLNGPPVQAQAGTMTKMNKGQTFQEEPRGVQPAEEVVPPAAPQASNVDQSAAPQASTNGDAAPDQATQPATVNPPGPNQMTPEPQTGMVGRRAGIETDEIEAPQ